MSKASKDDRKDGKPDYSLLPKVFLDQVAFCMQAGVEKYGRYNYTLGHNLSQLTAAAARHLKLIEAGEDVDQELSDRAGTEVTHAAAVCSNMLMLLHQVELGTLTDDRLCNTDLRKDPPENLKMCRNTLQEIEEEYSEEEMLEQSLWKAEAEYESIQLHTVRYVYLDEVPLEVSTIEELQSRIQGEDLDGEETELKWQWEEELDDENAKRLKHPIESREVLPFLEILYEFPTYMEGSLSFKKYTEVIPTSDFALYKEQYFHVKILSQLTESEAEVRGYSKDD